MCYVPDGSGGGPVVKFRPGNGPLSADTARRVDGLRRIREAMDAVADELVSIDGRPHP
jgi:hypothetical protein